MGGWVKPQLGFVFFWGEFRVFFCVFCVDFMFPKKKKKLDRGVGGLVCQSEFFSDFLFFLTRQDP